MGEDDIDCRTIGNASPAGICGSGLISLVAVLREASIISETGAFDPDRVDPASPLGSRLVVGRDGLEFVLAEPVPPSPRVVLTQRDVRELQLAKAAIRAGVEILLAESGIKADKLSQIVLAGAFGTYLDTRAATAIGLLPDAGDARLVSLKCRRPGRDYGIGKRQSIQGSAQAGRRSGTCGLGASPMFMQALQNPCSSSEDKERGTGHDPHIPNACTSRASRS